MTFPLTKTGRENLEAILAEFERAGRHYPPLYHERLIAWSEKGEVRLSDAQWQAFIDAVSNDLGDSEWSEWDGPHPANPDFNETYLGRWYGDPEGMAEFFNLVESLTDVLQREDFSSVDDLRTPFSFRSWNGWLSTIHAWAFRFRMPLLRCEMSLWGAENADQDEFIELAEQLSQAGDVSWPLHPLKWSLTYNVFTSSAAAIRAILRPETVIGINEPWLVTQRESRLATNDDIDLSATSCHLLVFDAVGWSIQVAGAARRLGTTYQAGLHRIAALIEKSGTPVAAEELSKFGGRSFRKGGRKLMRDSWDEGDGLTERKSLRIHENDIDREGVAKIEERIQEIDGQLEVATEAQREKLLEEIDWLKKTYHITADGRVIPKLIRDLQAKRVYDNVRHTIEDSLSDLKQRFTDQDAVIEELNRQVVYENKQFVFTPMAGLTPWKVVRRA